MLCSPALRTLVTIAISAPTGAYRVNTYGCPSARPFELVYPMAIQQDIKHARGKVVVGAVFKDDIDIRAFSFTEEDSFGNVTPPLTSYTS